MLSSLPNRLINSILVRLWTLVAAYAELHVEVPKPLSIMDWCTFIFIGVLLTVRLFGRN